MDSRDLFEILVRENAVALTLFIDSIVRDPGTADDIFQETLVVAWKNMHRFDRSRPFGKWLRGIASKIVLAERRKRARRPLDGLPEIMELVEGRVGEVERGSGDTLDEKLDCLGQCLRELPERFQEIVCLRYRDDLRGPSLAERLSISLDNAHKRLQRARKRLLECLVERLGADFKCALDPRMGGED